MREMLKFLKELRGNAKIMVLVQPLWGIPFNLFMPFATLYMYHLGVVDIQIGIILAVGRFMQMVMAFLGGVITDKLGRRFTFCAGDIIAWGIPLLIWAFAQDFRWFLIATIFNSVSMLTGVAGDCLFADEIGDDAPKLTQVYNWLQICGVLAIFFVPIAGFLVGRYNLVPVVRGLYIFAFICRAIRAILTYAFSVETQQGLERMRETKNIPLLRLFTGYQQVLRQIFRSGAMLRALVLHTLLNIVIMVSTTFFALYVTQNLGISESFLAYFPILRGVVMLVFLFFIQNRLSTFKPHYVMLCGIIAFLMANGVLLLTPYNNWLLVAGYTLIESCAAALLMPRLGALIQNAIEPRERARILGLFNVTILAIVIPFAYLAGFLSEINRRLPFVLNVSLFVVMFFFALSDARKKVVEV